MLLFSVVFKQIPNFFHLTPPAVMKHCAALKRKYSEVLLISSLPSNLSPAHVQ